MASGSGSASATISSDSDSEPQAEAVVSSVVGPVENAAVRTLRVLLPLGPMEVSPP